ncbi:Cullin family-domain-containing protein [Mycena metata]|uniref:Cullin family-domain-containing protein n=1 Tax=Mycena metata TaxID=1033252 RepID=A0AAD7MSF7_9AGAR|nr:Cullin family-domain-containing protein [Mycena metata]
MPLNVELVSRCEGVLLRAHAPRMWETFQGLEPLRRNFEAHIKTAGLAAVEGVVGGAAPAKKDAATDTDTEETVTKSGELDPKAYVDALLAVHEKNAATVARSFRGEADFAAALDKMAGEGDLEGALNQVAPTVWFARHELTERIDDGRWLTDDRCGGKCYKKTRLIAARRLVFALGVATAVPPVIILFKYLEDQDVFQTFYTTKLPKRLIHGVSPSDKAKASLIRKLNEACGFEYLYKQATGMFTGGLLIVRSASHRTPAAQNISLATRIPRLLARR